MKQITAITIAACLLSISCKKSSTSTSPTAMHPGTISYAYMGQSITYTGDTNTLKEYSYIRVEKGGPSTWLFSITGGLATDTINAVEVDLPSMDSVMQAGTYSGPVLNGVECAIKDPTNPAAPIGQSDSCNLTITSIVNGYATGTFNAYINGNYVSNGTFKNLYIYYDGL
jgi:hypothetical protein